MNTQRLLEAVAYLEQEPLRLDMNVYYCKANARTFREQQIPPPPCGTVMCIAGTVLYLEALRLNVSYRTVLYLEALRLNVSYRSLTYAVMDSTPAAELLGVDGYIC